MNAISPQRLLSLERLATRQQWTVSTAQLYSLGFSFAQVRGMVARRHLHRVHLGVYAVGRRNLSRQGWLFAALLACGDTAFVCHRSAVGIRGLCPINPYEIHVTVVGFGSRRRSGLIVHHASRQPVAGEVTTVSGVRASSVYRALVEAAADESQEWLERIVELGVRKRLIDVRTMEQTIIARPGARGLARLKHAIAAYRPRPFDKSGFERDVAAAIAADPSIPPPVRNAHQFAGNVDWELDFWWPEERVALEVDGGQYHLTPQDRERDRIKDAKLMAEGIAPLRITDVRWELDRHGAMDDLEAVLRSRRRSAS